MGGGVPLHLAEKTRLVVSESVPKREPRYVNRPWFHALMCPRFICDAVQLMILIRWANRSGDKNNVRTRRFGNCQRTAPPSTHYWRSPPHIPLFLLLPILLILLPLSTSTNLVKTMILNFWSQALFVFKRHCGHLDTLCIFDMLDGFFWTFMTCDNIGTSTLELWSMRFNLQLQNILQCFVEPMHLCVSTEHIIALQISLLCSYSFVMEHNKWKSKYR